MTRRSRRPMVAGCVALAVVSAACTSGGDAAEEPSELFSSERAASSSEETAAEPDAPTVSPSPAAEPSEGDVAASSSVGEDPFAVPEEITPEYVERVLNEIARRDAEITRQVLRSPVEELADVPAEFDEQLQELYVEPILIYNRRAFLNYYGSQEARDGLVPVDEYGQLHYEVQEVLQADDCLVSRVREDFSETDAVPDDHLTDITFPVLVRREGNATGWKMSMLIFSDAAPGSDEEAELFTMTIDDLTEHLPAECL